MANIRPLAERDLPHAQRVMHLAFGTFLGAPDPESFWADRDYAYGRFGAEHVAAFAAAEAGAVVGSNFATRWGSVGFFGPVTIRPPQSPADLPLAMWKLQIGLETVGRLERSELFCVVCDEAIALAAPPFVGFIKADLGPELCGLAVCELCSKAAGTFERLVEMVAEAVNGTAAPPPLHS